jgi:hypothetical protein
MKLYGHDGDWTKITRQEYSDLWDDSMCVFGSWTDIPEFYTEWGIRRAESPCLLIECRKEATRYYRRSDWTGEASA